MSYGFQITDCPKNSANSIRRFCDSPLYCEIYPANFSNMPRVIVSVNFEVGDKTAVLQGITDAVAGTLGKPANAHMVVLHTGAAISVGGTQDPAACIDLQTVTQLDSTLNKKLSAVLAEVGEAQLGVSPTRMYINFTQLQPSHWGKSGVLLEEILQQQSKQES